MNIMTKKWWLLWPANFLSLCTQPCKCYKIIILKVVALPISWWYTRIIVYNIWSFIRRYYCCKKGAATLYGCKLISLQQYCFPSKNNLILKYTRSKTDIYWVSLIATVGFLLQQLIGSCEIRMFTNTHNWVCFFLKSN